MHINLKPDSGSSEIIDPKRIETISLNTDKMLKIGLCSGRVITLSADYTNHDKLIHALLMAKVGELPKIDDESIDFDRNDNQRYITIRPKQL